MSFQLLDMFFFGGLFGLIDSLFERFFCFCLCCWFVSLRICGLILLACLFPCFYLFCVVSSLFYVFSYLALPDLVCHYEFMCRSRCM